MTGERVIMMIQAVAMLLSAMVFLVCFLRMLLMRPLDMEDGRPQRTWQAMAMVCGMSVLWALRDVYVLDVSDMTSPYGAAVRVGVLSASSWFAIELFDREMIWRAIRREGED